MEHSEHEAGWATEPVRILRTKYIFVSKPRHYTVCAEMVHLREINTDLVNQLHPVITWIGRLGTRKYQSSPRK